MYVMYVCDVNFDDPQSFSSLRDQGIGVDPVLSDPNSCCRSRLEFDYATNRGIPSPEAFQATSSKGNKQPVRRIFKKCTHRISK